MQAPARETTRFDSGVSKSGVFFILCSLCFYGAPETDSWQVGLLLGPLSMPELAIPACSAVAGWQPMRFFFLLPGVGLYHGEGGRTNGKAFMNGRKGPGMGLGGAAAWTLMGPPA
jgi:hypothetical protein